MTNNEAERRPVGVQGEQDAMDPHAHPTVWRPRLERMIDRQIELYERLVELTNEQQGLIEQEEGDTLLDLLHARQGYVDEVAEHNELLEPFVREWETLSALLEKSDRIKLSARLDTLMGLIDRIVGRDEECRKVITAKRERVGDELTSMTRNKAAVNTYAKSGVTNSPRYQDRRA